MEFATRRFPEVAVEAGEPRMAIAVANSFVELGIKAKDPIDPLKLQKLCFIAHGFYLALHDAALLDEDIQAWPYGPVVPSIYHAFKIYGNKPIRQVGFDFDDRGNLTKTIVTAPIESALIAKVAKTYGNLSGIRLSNWTHLPASPWSIARENNPWNLRYTAIPNDIIRTFFQGLLNIDGLDNLPMQV